MDVLLLEQNLVKGKREVKEERGRSLLSNFLLIHLDIAAQSD